VTRRGYQNRSEALRDLARAGMRQADPPKPNANCVAALVYVYDHARRDLPNRLANEFHDHHSLAVSTLHVHLDAESCLEVAVLKGAVGAVRHMADHVIAERGVRHAQLIVLPQRAVST
jgi:CopG family transcriptional regulator, nickel-responsive regulator